MRHYKLANGRPAVRSEPNGPVEWKLFDTKTLYSGKPLQLRYKAAKPYSWMGYDILQTPDQSLGSEGILLPPNDLVMGSIVVDKPDVSNNLFSDIVDSRYATNRALENAQAYGNLLMLVSAAEAKDTVLMIRKVFVRLYEAAVAFYKHIRKLNIIGTMEELSSLWLEFRYGWRPLALEAKAVYEQLQRVHQGGVLSSYGSDKLDPTVTERTFFSDLTYLNETYRYEHTVKCVGQVVTKTGFNYVNRPGSRNDDPFAHWGLDWASIASTVWELIPFSVFIDMFFNIGNLLQARDVHDQVDSFNYWQTFVGQFEVSSKLVNIHTAGFKTFREVMTLDEHLAISFHPLFRTWVDRMEARLAKIQGNYAFYLRLPSYRGEWVTGLDDPFAKKQINKCQDQLTRMCDYHQHDNYAEAFPSWYNMSNYGRKSREETNYAFWNNHVNWYLPEDQRAQFRSIQSDWPTVTVATIDGVDLDAVGVIEKLNQIFARWLGANARIASRIEREHGPMYGYTLYVWTEMIGNSEYQFLTDEQSERSKIVSEIDTVQRILLPEFSHSSTLDADLAVGQWADLAALAMQFFSQFRNK